MDSIQKILEDSRIQAFWKYHASRLNYQKEISKLNPFINKVKLIAKRNIDPKIRNNQKELDLDLLIQKIMNCYVSGKINTEQFLKLLKINCDIGRIDNTSPLYIRLEPIIKKIHTIQKKCITDKLVFIKMKIVNDYYKKIV